MPYPQVPGGAVRVGGPDEGDILDPVALKPGIYPAIRVVVRADGDVSLAIIPPDQPTGRERGQVPRRLVYLKD